MPASNVRLSFADTQYTMIREGSGWWAVIGIGALFQRGDYTLTATWQGGSISTSLTVLDGGFTRESLTLPPGSSALLTDPARIQDERFLLASIHATFTPERFWNGRFLLPAQAPVTDPFGLMRSINGGAYLPHSGTDLAGDEGDLVIAAASGRVALARELYLYGNSVIIDHGGGVFTGYHHLSQIVPTEGESINAGDLVGTVGETGLVTGPHLHWELVVHGVRIDPLPWTRREITP